MLVYDLVRLVKRRFSSRKRLRRRHPNQVNASTAVECLEDRTLLSNSSPVFSQDDYSFSVASDIAEFSVIGAASATDADGDYLNYFGAGGPFYIDYSGDIVFGGPTGGIFDGDEYVFSLTVDDGTGLTDTANVTISVGGGHGRSAT
ncbi:MAG: hypothetical protein CMJ78_07790 [Planctomycetaceae bacterium]|nr:hypothetical protein [Planctomycetaceae bacterium]